MRHKLRDICSSHEWLTQGATHEYHRWCEGAVASKLDALASSWTLSLNAAPHVALADRATALRQKVALCTEGGA